MAELQSLTKIFNNALYRIPDYQRGYAWQEPQLQDFWFDLLNLDSSREHYTGVITLKLIPKATIAENANERWLINDGYSLNYVIDGQQRLTTCMILIQSVLETVRNLPDNKEKEDTAIVFGKKKIEYYVQTFLKESSADGVITTYKFGYETDNPSYEYFRYRILNEAYPGTIEETFYTLNLQNAKTFFLTQLQALLTEGGIQAVEQLFQKLTTSFLFNPYTIPDAFDEFVAFETMNNRGKRLSNLELLKNRLIYLTTLYTETEANTAVKKGLRENINDTWKEVYFQLGRNKNHPLNDDDFLRAHWIMYFMYTRKKGDDYVKFLLGKQFTATRVLKKKSVPVKLEEVDEIIEDAEDAEENGAEEFQYELRPDLSPKEINDFVNSLKESARAWHNSFFPTNNTEIPNDIAVWIDRLNRSPISYFRPLVMSLLLKGTINQETKVRILKEIERFLFIGFRLNKTYSNSGSSEFYNAARELYHDVIGEDQLIQLIGDQLAFYYEGGQYKFNNFKQLIKDRFNGKTKEGFYKWPGLQYFLYEYELKQMGSRKTIKIDFNALFKNSEKDKYSIEHILPQTPTDPYWQQRFGSYSPEQLNVLSQTVGNLLPLSLSINSSLQNDCFDAKRQEKRDKQGSIIRNGYSNGSYSEIEVSQKTEWTAGEIKERGLQLLRFMEERWDISLGDDNDKLKILSLNFLSDPPTDDQQ